jgi:hypothetical protein
MEDRYYLYIHIRLDNNQIFYVGIGSKCKRKTNSIKSIYNRAYSKHNRNKYWLNITNKVDYEVKIILESNNYENIKNNEIEFIQNLGKKINNDGCIGLSLEKTEKHKENLSVSLKQYYNNLSPEEYIKITSKCRLGSKLNENHKEKLINSRNKKIICLNLITNKEIIYNSIRSCARDLNIDHSNIVKCLKNNENKIKNYEFKYYTEFT